jgi:hypothetical protein
MKDMIFQINALISWVIKSSLDSSVAFTLVRMLLENGWASRERVRSDDTCLEEETIAIFSKIQLVIRTRCGRTYLPLQRN